MSESLHQSLICQARAQYGDIVPANGRPTFDSCFTRIDNKIVFWFNTKDDSTHILTALVTENGD